VRQRLRGVIPFHRADLPRWRWQAVAERQCDERAVRRVVEAIADA
jgi:hypothetical protein